MKRCPLKLSAWIRTQSRVFLSIAAVAAISLASACKQETPPPSNPQPAPAPRDEQQPAPLPPATDPAPAPQDPTPPQDSTPSQDPTPQDPGTQAPPSEEESLPPLDPSTAPPVVQQPSPLQPDQIRIITVNSLPNSYQDTGFAARPDTSVSFRAAGFSNGQMFDLPADQLIWTSSELRQGADCNQGRVVECTQNTGGKFYVNAQGVTYNPDRSMPEKVFITVRTADGSLQDSLAVTNDLFQQVRDLPAQPIVSYETYPYSSFDPYIALMGQGTWVWIGNVQYFKPRVQDEDPFWSPNTYGHWRYDDVLGYVWESNEDDSIGWATSHYGVWRYHAGHRWVWYPYTDHAYRPSCVSFVNTAA